MGRTPPFTGRTPIIFLYAHPLDMYGRLLIPVAVTIQSLYIHESFVHMYYPENSGAERYLQVASLYL